MLIHPKAQDAIDLCGYRGWTKDEVINASLYCFVRQIQLDQESYLKIARNLLKNDDKAPEAPKEAPKPLEASVTGIDITDMIPDVTIDISPENKSKPIKRRGRPKKQPPTIKEDKKAEDMNLDDVFNSLDSQ